MQPPIVMAFRKRLKKKGYTDIKIKKSKVSSNYVVTAIEPLADTECYREYCLHSMHHFR